MNLEFFPSIEIIMGPVQSGKTTELLQRLLTHDLMGRKVLYINSVLDTRSSTEFFSTHNLSIGNVPFKGVKLDRLAGYDISEYDVIGIDESQFFEDLKVNVLKWVESYGKMVLVYGLDGDYKRENFGQISELLSYCDNITKLKAFCMSCKKKGASGLGIFSKRLVDNSSSVLIGGEEMYSPVCRRCYVSS
jgi:thymidine kinase